MKICVLGCGLRTPLLLHGLIHSEIGIGEVALFDSDLSHSQLMAGIGGELARGTNLRVWAEPRIERAIDGAAFVISSIRVGNMETRAADERIALECGFAGQETTGPAGFAMALRTIPFALEHARLVERITPSAWIINFTNPAGIVTQAVSTLTGAKVVGICDTPAELFFQIARALGEPPDEVQCAYFGLNHLGWVSAVWVRGQNVIGGLLRNDDLLRHLYPTELFPPALIREIGAIPTEYLFYYYSQALARDNQLRAGVTRGEELTILNHRIQNELEAHVGAGDTAGALQAYRRYLNRRNASYMRLDGAGQSAFEGPDPDWDPFEGATGYHRIAVSAIGALTSADPRRLVLNVPNHGAVEGLAGEDVVEVPCLVSHSGPRPETIGAPPESVRGLMLSVKHYERLTVEAAFRGRWDLAGLALTANPIVGTWEAARPFLARLAAKDQKFLSHFTNRDILRSAIC